MTTLATAPSDSVAPGTLGFLVVFGLAVALCFLFRSMSKHLRKVDAAARRAGTASAGDDPAASAGDDPAASAAANDRAAGTASASPARPRGD